MINFGSTDKGRDDTGCVMVCYVATLLPGDHNPERLSENVTLLHLSVRL